MLSLKGSLCLHALNESLALVSYLKDSFLVCNLRQRIITFYGVVCCYTWCYVIDSFSLLLCCSLSSYIRIFLGQVKMAEVHIIILHMIWFPILLL